MDISKAEFPFFKKITFINDPKEGLAKTARSTGELVINMHYWPKLIDAHKYFVLCHEEGHIKFDTSDELKADDWAAERYFKSGLPISESVKVLTEHLDRNKPVHIARAWMQYNRALKFDYQKNHNIKAYRKFYDTEDTIIEKLKENAFK